MRNTYSPRDLVREGEAILQEFRSIWENRDELKGQLSEQDYDRLMRLVYALEVNLQDYKSAKHRRELAPVDVLVTSQFHQHRENLWSTIEVARSLKHEIADQGLWPVQSGKRQQSPIRSVDNDPVSGDWVPLTAPQYKVRSSRPQPPAHERFHSCFFSYSAADGWFSEQLYVNLMQAGVQCWFAPKDMKIGEKIRPRIDESIYEHDKLLLVLSEHSVASSWVEQEVETALERERKYGKTVLFPIRLDDAVLEIETGWPALIRNTRHIGDFTQWMDHDAYQAAFARLLRDLQAEGG